MFKPVHLHQWDVLKNLTEAIFTRSQGPDDNHHDKREDHSKYNLCVKLNQLIRLQVRFNWEIEKKKFNA